MKEENILIWHSPEHHFDQKTVDWYWYFGIIVVAIAFLSFYFGDMLFGIFIILAGAILGILSYKDTKVVPISISKRGIVFGTYLYPWTAYESFWIEDEHIHGARMLLRPRSQFMPISVIPINEEVDLNEVREAMLIFIEEEHMQESPIHKWFDHLMRRY